jgi:DNA repair protein RadA/Sms
VAKLKTVYVCTSCATKHPKWQGRCNGCGQWNTLVEDVEAVGKSAARMNELVGPLNRAVPLRLSEVEAEQYPRLVLDDPELMRVLDGGLVPGALVLLGGEPGIGKSTLLLQIAQRMTGPVLYVTGEESAHQVKLRAQRLTASNPDLHVLPDTNLEGILRHAEQMGPALLVIDSIQTLASDSVESAAGSVSQVRECAARLMRFAKDTGTPTVLVGHITKEGSLAGPKVLEHMVDVVLEFEGDRHQHYRILRSTKNRFGATPELGLYDMRPDGLHPVLNPSELFLTHGAQGGGELSGVAIAATLQAQRPLLVEVQALVADAAYGTPQRSATGYDQRRLGMLLAVLERKVGLRLGQKDVFVNLAGGIRLDEPALDLAIAAAIASSYLDIPVPVATAFAGELGLTGEVRAVARLEPRLVEAARLGFKAMIVGGAESIAKTAPPSGLTVTRVSRLSEAFEPLFRP